MIERAIENWLTSTTERNYQVAFCQTLLQKGHRILYVSSHSIMEQGKDIISMAPNGDCCAYQLKTGNIDLSQWRKIHAEIEELIELPVVHPTVSRDRIHKSYLVTNGEITDPVRFQITQMNEDNQKKNRKYSYLDVITLQGLLRDFIDAQGKFIPYEPEDFQIFLELFLADGSDFLDKEKYSTFLRKSVLTDTSEDLSSVLNAISSSVILTAYILRPYQVKGNFLAEFEAWTMLWVSVLHYVETKRFKDDRWMASISLIEKEVNETLDSLTDETLQRQDFLEGVALGDGGYIYRARATIVLGVLCMRQLYLIEAGKKDDRDARVLGLLKSNLNTLWFWGESAFPFFINIIQYLESKGEKKQAEDLLKILLQAVIERNSAPSKSGFASPYYNACDVLETILQIKPEAIDFYQFVGRSYILEPIVEMLARRGKREDLEKNWRRITHIFFEELEFDRVQDLFAWRAEKGVNTARQPNMTQSWSALVNEAINLEGVPALYRANHKLVRFWLVVSPHRVNRKTVKLLDMSNSLRV